MRDINQGLWPKPNCTGEEMALHKIIEMATEDDFGHLDEDYDALPVHEEDDDFETISDVMFQDHDVLMLFDSGPMEKFMLGEVCS